MKSRSWMLLTAVAVVMTAAVLFIWQSQAYAEVTENQIEQWRVEASAGADTHALEYLQDAAAHAQIPAMRALGEVYLHRGKPNDAIKLLTDAASQGDTGSATILGKAYFLGHDGIAKDDAQAFKWLSISGAKNDPNAAYYLGLIYKSGYGVPSNAATAAHWFGIAAQHDLPAGLFMLGNAYRDGDGVAKDEAHAVALYKQAADLDLPEAIQTLAMAEQNGELGLKYTPEEKQRAMFEMGHALKDRPAAP